jgi:hypothetical protein
LKKAGAHEVVALSEWVMAKLGPEVPLHFTAFHPDYKMLDTPPTPAATLTRAREIARAAGLLYAYTANVHDEAGGSTYHRPVGGARRRVHVGNWRRSAPRSSGTRTESGLLAESLQRTDRMHYSNLDNPGDPAGRAKQGRSHCGW